MNRLIKTFAAVALALVGGSLFAYNGGYENSLDYQEYPGVGYGNYTLAAREESGTTIDANRYAQCKALKSVDLTGVTSIGDAAFAYSALETLTIPSTVSSMGFIAFGGCTNLTSVTIKGWNWLTGDGSVVAKEPFAGTTKLTTLSVPGGVPSKNLLTIFPALATIRCPAASVAQWKEAYPSCKVVNADEFRVNFDGMGATSQNSKYKTVNRGKAYGTMAAVTKTGYKFLGWFTKKEGGSQVKSTTIVTESEEHTLYARWKACGYKVTFNGNGADSQNATYKTVVFDSAYGTLARVEKSGYVLGGWYTAATGGSRVEATTVVKTASNHTLYARWVKSGDKIRVNFDGNGATTQNAAYKSAPYAGKYGTLASVTKTGYIFLGWYTAKMGGTLVTSASTVQTPCEHTLYAQWLEEGKRLRVDFDGNGATTLNSDHKTVVFNEKYGVLAKATRTGFIFMGWYTEKTGGDQQTSASKVKIPKNHTLYARWVAEGTKVRVDFDGNGSGVSLNSDHKTVTFYEKYGVLARATRSGYVFDGWFTAPSGGTKQTSASKVKTAERHTLYAHWTQISKGASVSVARSFAANISGFAAVNDGYYSGTLADDMGSYYLIVDDPSAKQSNGYVYIVYEDRILNGECIAIRCNCYWLILIEEEQIVLPD